MSDKKRRKKSSPIEREELPARNEKKRRARAISSESRKKNERVDFFLTVLREIRMCIYVNDIVSNFSRETHIH